VVELGTISPFLFPANVSQQFKPFHFFKLSNISLRIQCSSRTHKSVCNDWIQTRSLE